MLKIKIDLIKLSSEEAQDQGITAAALNENKMTEGERLARDILAPLAVAELMRHEGNQEQKQNAHTLGEIFANCGAVCGDSLWFCGSGLELAALTLADNYRPRAFGRVAPGGCFVLIWQQANTEKERAYLVRPNWNR